MATETDNYGFILPEKDDKAKIADINSNMEEIDRLLKAAEDERTEKALEAEHKIKTYTSYTKLGLTTADFAADDFLANAQKIYEKMPDYSELRMTCYNSNLATSIIKKINADLNGTWGTGNSLILCIKRTSKTYPAEINVMIDYTGSEKIYTCILNNYNNVFTVSAFAVTYTPSGYVAKTGDTMSGNLTIEKSQPTLYLKDTGSGRQIKCYMENGVAYIRNVLDSNNRTTIALKPETDDIGTLVWVSTLVNGQLTSYNLFGEHNIDLIAESFARCTTPLTLSVTDDGILQITY